MHVYAYAYAQLDGVARARPRRLDGIMINLKHNVTVSRNCRLRRRLARLRSQSRERRLKRTFACKRAVRCFYG